MGGKTRRRGFPLDIHAGVLVGGFSAVYTAVVGWYRGMSPDVLSGQALGVLVAAFTVAGLVVGSVIAGRPDFGPSKRTALVRGFVAAIPVYAAGGLLFLPASGWFSLLPLMSVIAAGLVGPPIGIFMYRLHRRSDVSKPAIEPGGELAWLKGEMLGSWTPLLMSIAVLGALGVGMRAIPDGVASPSLEPPEPPSIEELVEAIPSLREVAHADSTNPEAWLDLGFALTSLGQFNAAVDCLGIAVSLDSTRVESWTTLGRAAFYAGQMPQAARAYWNALKRDPGALAPNGLDRVILDAVLNSTILMSTDEG